MENESLEVSARTVDDAIRRAAEMLRRSPDDLQVTVLSEGSRGILGIGGEDAHILVSIKPSPQEPVVEEVAASASTTVAEPVTEPETIAEEADATRASQRAVPLTDEQVRDARAVLLDLLDLMGLDTDVEVHRRDSTLVLEVVGEDLGLLIGRRGESLTSLQFILNLMLAKRLRRWARVIVDVEGYRSRREETLTGLARRVAFRVHETGQPVALEAMPAGERRIIHMALADHPHVSTGSVGEGDHRKVVISPKR